jgi:hypothetical protein
MAQERVIVVQYETRRDTALRLLMKYTQDYCLQHGYMYYCPDKAFDLPTYWIKVKLIQELFQTVPVGTDLIVAWVDSDAVFVRPEVRIQDILGGAQSDFVSSLDPGSTTIMNAGVFFIRRTERTRKIVDEWMDGYVPSRWSKSVDENGEMKWKTVGKWAGPDYEQGSFNDRILPKYRQEIVLLPEKVLACYEPFYEPETVVCHFMYKHKWKIWVYNAMRRSPELLTWLGIGALALFFTKKHPARP